MIALPLKCRQSTPMHSNKSPTHISVLMKEVLHYLAPGRGDMVIDATCGLGGHTAALAEAVGKKGRVLAVDTDSRNIALAKKQLSSFANITFVHNNFQHLTEHATPSSSQGMLFDLGVSSAHLDDPTRGFSFRVDAPLDLRLDASQGFTAAKALRRLSEKELADIFFTFGHIRSSRKLALAVSHAAKKGELETTLQLKKIVEDCGCGKVLAQAFQAIRIYINDELAALQKGLLAAENVLAPGGRVVVISFHSLEDGMVKRFFKSSNKLSVITKKPLRPSSEEVELNPRARSACLRCAEKL